MRKRTTKQLDTAVSSLLKRSKVARARKLDELEGDAEIEGYFQEI